MSPGASNLACNRGRAAPLAYNRGKFRPDSQAHRARLPNLTFNYFIHEMKYIGEIPTMSINYPTLAHFRHFRHSFNYNIFPDTQIMQNKANFENVKMNINLDMISNYKNLSRWLRPKNKANSNPIQTQFNPIQTQFKPISNPNKANSQKAKCDFLAELTNLKGANFKHLTGHAVLMKTTIKMLRIFNNLLISPPFLIDNSIDYALYRLKEAHL